MIDQHFRSMPGLTPDGVWGNPVTSSRFLSHVDEMHVMDRAISLYRPGMKSVTVTMHSPVGEGFRAGGSPYFRSSQAVVRFGLNGRPYTAYPLP